MIDINIVRDNPNVLKKSLEKRQMDPSVVDTLSKLDITWRAKLTEAEELKAERNKASKAIGKTKDKAEREAKIAKMRKVGDRISALDEEVKVVEKEMNDLIATIPNILDENVPLGKDENDNVVVRQVGEIPVFDFKPQPHWDLGPALGIMDFEQGVKITGSRFYVLSGAGARLQRALISGCWTCIAGRVTWRNILLSWSKPTPCSLPGSYRNSRIICTTTTKKTCGWCQPQKCR